VGAIAIDLNNPTEVRTAGRRVLVDTLGADGARVFLNNYVQEHSPRIARGQIAAIMVKAGAEAVDGRGKGTGDYTKERHELPEPPLEELLAAFGTREAEMGAIQREYPEYTLNERLREQARREAERRSVANETAF
jgi:hypothetical protein